MDHDFTRFGLPTLSGAVLNVYTSQAANPIGIIQINHGLAEHAARYQAFAAKLNAAGFHVYAQDHRGHGATKAPDAERGFFGKGDMAQIVLDDVADLHSHITQQHPDLPIIIFGHSMGGLIAMNYALQNPDHLAGVAIWNSNFSGGILGRLAQTILKFERWRLGSDVPSRILPKLTFETWGKLIKNARTPFDWLSHIPEEVDLYIADPHCGWDASVGMWQTIFDWVFKGGDAKALAGLPQHLPFHLLGGGEDPATEKASATRQQAKRLQDAGLNEVAMTIYPTARHETLNDLVGDKATQAFILWATKWVQTK